MRDRSRHESRRHFHRMIAASLSIPYTVTRIIHRKGRWETRYEALNNNYQYYYCAVTTVCCTVCMYITICVSCTWLLQLYFYHVTTPLPFRAQQEWRQDLSKLQWRRAPGVPNPWAVSPLLFLPEDLSVPPTWAAVDYRTTNRQKAQQCQPTKKGDESHVRIMIRHRWRHYRWLNGQIESRK